MTVAPDGVGRGAHAATTSQISGGWPQEIAGTQALTIAEAAGQSPTTIEPTILERNADF